MKQAILIFLALATLTGVASCATVASTSTVTVGFLPKDVTHVPLTYFFGTLSLFFSLVSLTLLGRSWERDALPEKFIDAGKYWAMILLLLASLPAMIFLSVVFQEIKPKPKKSSPDYVQPRAEVPLIRT